MIYRDEINQIKSNQGLDDGEITVSEWMLKK
jgi:hypothetical protein